MSIQISISSAVANVTSSKCPYSLNTSLLLLQNNVNYLMLASSINSESVKKDLHNVSNHCAD